MSISLIRVSGYVALVAAGFLVLSAGFDAVAGNYAYVLPRSLTAVSLVCLSLVANLYVMEQDKKDRH